MLRKFDRPTSAHPLLSVEVDYLNALTGKRERITSSPLVVARPDLPLISLIPSALDVHLNRYTAATAISEAIDLAAKFQFPQARAKLAEVMSRIEQSPSKEDQFCADLVQDLAECQKCLSDAQALKTGIHQAHAFASMYFMERSAGLAGRVSTMRRIGPSPHPLQCTQTSLFPPPLLPAFHSHPTGYGYVTAEQETKQHEAVSYANNYAADHSAQFLACH